MDYNKTANSFAESLYMDVPIKKKLGPKTKPKVEAIIIFEKMKRGRRLMGEKKIDSQKKMLVLKSKVSF